MIYIYVHFSTAAEDAPLLFRGAHLKVTMAAMLSLLPPLKSSKCSSQAIVQTLELSGYVIKLRGCLSGLLFNCPIPKLPNLSSVKNNRIMDVNRVVAFEHEAIVGQARDLELCQ